MKQTEKAIWVVETKGREDSEDPHKLERLKQWCEDINRVESRVKYDWLYVKEEEFKKYTPKDFIKLIGLLRTP